MTITEAFAKYDLKLQCDNRTLKTRKNYRSALNSFIDTAGDCNIETISNETIDLWKLDMTRRGNLPSSIRPNVCKMCIVLNYARDRKRVELSPEYYEADIRRSLPKLNKKAYRWLDPEGVDQLAKAAKNMRDEIIIRLMFDSGFRVGELVNLNREHLKKAVIDGGYRKFKIIGKGDKEGDVFVSPKIWDMLQKYLNTRDDCMQPVFTSGQHKRITVSRVEQIVADCRARSGIQKNITPHDLRHSYATNLYMKTKDLLIVKQLLRHSNIATTQVYTHVDTSARVQALALAHTY